MPKTFTRIRPRISLSTALVVWDIWTRLPPKQRQRLLAQARRHGPRLAKGAYAAQRRRRAAKRAAL